MHHCFSAYNWRGNVVFYYSHTVTDGHFEVKGESEKLKGLLR
jgi:hypothetical protein